MKSLTPIAILLAVPAAVAQSGDDWNFQREYLLRILRADALQHPTP